MYMSPETSLFNICRSTYCRAHKFLSLDGHVSVGFLVLVSTEYWGDNSAYENVCAQLHAKMGICV